MLLVAWFMVSGVRYPRSRGIGLIAEAAGLAVAVVGLVGLIDVRVPALLAVVRAVVVVTPRPSRVRASPHDRAARWTMPVERAEP